MPRRTGSSQRWRQRQERDIYVEQASREGWRSRAVFKLEQIQRAEKLLRPGMIVVDLGAAPGGWSQFATRALQGRGEIIAVDVLPMPHIPGVTFIEGDFQQQDVLDKLLAALGGRPVDLVMSDMAPNMSGIDAVDQPQAMNLAELALDLATQVLKPGGDLLLKVFQGAGFQELVQSARKHFTKVKLRKPDASRARSAEMYLLARSRRMV